MKYKPDFLIHPALTEEQKIIIDAQSDMLDIFAREVLRLNPIAISRDKQDHLLILTIDKYAECILCHMLGFNKYNNTLTTYVVGNAYIDFKFRHKDLKLSTLAVHPAFLKNKIGSILHQAVENFAISKGFEAINITALRCFEDVSANKLSLQDIRTRFSLDEQESYIRKNFYDKNINFYGRLGYQSDKDQPKDYRETYEYMHKKNLKKLAMQYGFVQPLTYVNRYKLSRPISSYTPNPRYNNIYELANSNSFDYNLFNNEFNNFPCELFHPISFSPTMENLEFLKKLLSMNENILPNDNQPVFDTISQNPFPYFDTNPYYLNHIKEFINQDKPIKFVNNISHEINKIYQNALDELSSSSQKE